MGKRRQQQDSNSDEDDSNAATTSKRTAPEIAKTAKKPKFGESREQASTTGPAVKVYKNAEGEKYVDLGKKKRAAVRSFKGQIFVDIREFYGDEGDEKPGKKGISLTTEQWEALKQSISTIDSFFTDQHMK